MIGSPTAPSGKRTLFFNGHIRTFDAAQPLVEAVAVSRGRIVACGRSADLRAAFSQFTPLDLGGRTVLPGFTDCHIHLPSYGLSLRRVDLTGTRSLREAVDRVRAAVERAAPGGWVRGRGWNQNIWAEDRFPTSADLDPASPTNPVVLGSNDGHLLWTNAAALRAAGVTRSTADPPGGEIARDAHGEPTGLLKETAKDLVFRHVPPVDAPALERAIREAASVMHRLGITGIHNFTGTDPFDGAATFAAFQRLARSGDLRLRVWMTIPEQGLDHAVATGPFQRLARSGDLRLRAWMTIPEQGLDHAVATGLRTGVGDEWLRVGPVKIFADGTLGSQTAAMLEPFEGQPQNTGIAIHSRDELIELVRRAVAGGFWCAIHAIGDRASRWVLDAYEVSRDVSQQIGARHRIEHVQVIHPDDLPRLARLSVIASMQPIHATSDRDIADRYWGARSRHAYAWGSLRHTGTALAFGSDAPVETPDVFQGLYAAVTRRRATEPEAPPWYPDETVEIDEALGAYTVGAAYAAGREASSGRIAAGCVADFIVVDRDPITAPANELLQARIEATVLDGEIVYAAPSFSA